jgi:MSHA pilin protein MshD
MCTRHNQRGISLIELIMFIVIISVALAGILLVMNNVTRHSADTLVRKQALAVAESLLEEIELQDFIAVAAVAPATPANRSTVYHIVTDYDGYKTAGAGIFTFDNSTAIAGLGNYNVSPVGVVAITAGELGPLVPAASAVRITVSVTDPSGQATVVTGYRTAY